MDTSPITGFITRRQASDNCKRSERTLQRYWSTAIEVRDTAVLDHLKLHTEDGDVIDGPDVTKDLIEDLKKRRKNPTWYVHAAWVLRTYGPRSGAEESLAKAESAQPQPLPPIPAAVPTQTHVSLLEQRVGDLERDKEHLQSELKIKNEQINQANERSRETHVLMRDLHALLRDMQHRLPTPAALPLAVAAQPERGSESAAAARPQGPRKAPAARKRAPAQSARKAKWYEMPTFRRILSRSS
jgi:hypothetical protein